MCKPVRRTRSGVGLGLAVLGASLVGAWLVAPSVILGLALLLVAIKVAVVAVPVLGLGYVACQFADCIPAPSGLVRRTVRTAGVIAGQCRVVVRIPSGLVRRRALRAAQSPLALPAPAPVRALTVAELAALRATGAAQ